MTLERSVNVENVARVGVVLIGRNGTSGKTRISLSARLPKATFALIFASQLAPARAPKQPFVKLVQGGQL